MKYSATSSVLSVSELTHSIKTSLELQYRFIHIQGEISNLRIPYSGHMYFTLKDEKAQIRAVLFKNQQKYLQQQLKEGQSIICHGRLSVYEPRGEYQIIVDTVDFTGTGNLQIKFEQLKRDLAAEGLFRSEIKKPVPAFPEHLVLITSPTGAAVHDFLRIAAKRKYWGKISIFPVAVQGENSSTEIAAAIGTVEKHFDPDVIVLLRGGGSLEDLWSFNEEKTARAIYLAETPIVTGIGHDIDFTIADMCADLHTHTPTAAAEAILADSQTLLEEISYHRSSLGKIIEKRLVFYEDTIRSLRRVMGNLDLYLANYSLKIDYKISSLVNAIQRKLTLHSARVEGAAKKLHYQAPLTKISFQELKLQHLHAELFDSFTQLLSQKGQELARHAAVLDSVSPLAILGRGYSIVSKSKRSGEDVIVSSTTQVDTGDLVKVKLHQGRLECEVKNKKDDAEETLFPQSR